MLDIVQSFAFIFLLYCGSHECVYISPIYNVEASLFFCEYNKIRDSLFSLLKWYQSQRENLIYFFDDRVSFQSLYSPFGTLHRRISSPPPPPMTFPACSSPVINLRFRGTRGRSTRRWQPRRKTAPHAPSHAASLRHLAVHAPARVRTCGLMDHFSVTGLHIQARPTPSCCSILPTVHPEPSLSTFFPISAPPHSVS